MSISKINAQQSLRATQAIAAMRSNTAAADAAKASPTRQPDAVTLSPAARAISAARRSAGGGPAPIREDRISAIRAAIASGTYRVDSEQLARSMIKNLAG